MKGDVLGISGTPLKDGSCDKLVEEALRIPGDLGDVEREFITLADEEIAMCTHCQWCVGNRAPCQIKDDVHMIFDKMEHCDGVILGAPTWFKVAAPLLLNMLSRARYIGFFTHKSRNKIVGALSVGFLDFGLERTTDMIKAMVSGLNMIPVAEGKALSSTWVFGQRPSYLEHGVLDGPFGTRQAEWVGIRIVAVARMIKYGTQAGIALSEEYLRTGASGRTRPPEEKVFIDGVWREQVEPQG